MARGDENEVCSRGIDRGGIADSDVVEQRTVPCSVAIIARRRFKTAPTQKAHGPATEEARAIECDAARRRQEIGGQRAEEWKRRDR